MKLEKTNSGKLRTSDALAAAVAAEFAAGESLPKTIAKLDAKTGEKTIHLVSPVYWRLLAESRGSIASDDPKKLRAAVLAARKAGERREVVAIRAGISVAEVAKLEGKKPVYTGRGTRRHLASA